MDVAFAPVPGRLFAVQRAADSNPAPTMPPPSNAVRSTTRSAAVSGAFVLTGIAAVGALDFVTGIELYVFPLYFAPVVFAAWHLGRAGAIAAAALSTAAWLGSNQLAGLRFSLGGLWVVNVILLAAALTAVGLLAAAWKAALDRERSHDRTDALCGLLTSGAFYHESNRLLRLCRRGRRPATLAVLDLDNFTKVIATHGQRAGDDLLRAVAQVLQASVRASDVTARLGADDFAIFLPELGADEARQTLDRIRARLARPLGGIAEPVSVTIGAATFTIVPDEVQMMVRIADAVMHSAKQSGKDRVKLEVITSERLPADIAVLYASSAGRGQLV